MLRKVILCILAFWMLTALDVLAQTTLLKGTVVDNEGTPLPGVSVFLKNVNNGGATSIDGKYVLSGVTPKDTVVFSYVGFDTQSFVIGTKQIIDVVMLENSNELEEVTVVAFQRQKKESVIASISTMSPKDLKVPQSNMTTALAGRIAGLISYQRSGEPGQDNAEFFIRGVTTFGYGNSPLILIDGLESTTEDLARMEPDNVESFSLMKDATATALYGARGANGVVLVTTKTGKKGKMSVSARVETSISTPTRMSEFMDGVSYMEMYNTAIRMRHPEYPLYYSKDKIEGTRQGLNPEIYPNVDWYGELFNRQVQNMHANISASGGGDVARYYLSISYTDENGLLKVDPLNNFNNNIDISRFNVRANIDFDLTKSTKAALKYYALFDRYNGPATEASKIFEYVMDANPVNFPKTYTKPDDFHFVKHTLFGNMGDGRADAMNPYAQMVNGYKDRFNATNQAQFQVEQDLSMFTKGLNIRGLVSMNVTSSNQIRRSFSPYYYGMIELNTDAGVLHTLRLLSEGSESLGTPVIENGASSAFYIEAAAQYNRMFGKHDVGALLVFSAREGLNEISLDNAETRNNVLSSLPVRNMGLSGRATYGFDRRYYLELNFGYNGSEKFEKDKRWGFFPSAGLGWTVSNEKFYGDGLARILSLLKLKATYGLVGNDKIASDTERFFYLSQVSTSDSGYGYAWGDASQLQGYNGYTTNRYANNSISWEVATKANYGIELRFWDKLNLQVDYFTEQRDNIYQAFEYIPATMGLTAGLSNNIGKAKSNGVDIAADFSHSVNKDIWFAARGNFTFAHNEVLANGEPDYEYPYLSRIGQPIKQQWGYVAERLFIDEQDRINSPNQFGLREALEGGYMAGDIKYVDVNKDGKIDENDRVPIGYPTVPEITYGVGLSSGWKNVDFSFFFQGSARSSFFIDPAKIAPFTGSTHRNALKVIAEDYWSHDNPDPYAFWPRMSTETVANNNKASTWWLRDGSFLRLKSVELGYSLPAEWTRKYAINSARIYLSGSNLYCFSNFKLWDPEMGDKGLGYPPQSVYNIGFQFSF
jgi:TonB-linked SusC/RagA family outer membrane protein